jgi:hypothetical protein
VAVFLAMFNIHHPWTLPMLKLETNIITKLNNKKITRPRRSRFLISGGRPEGSKRNLKFQSTTWP